MGRNQLIGLGVLDCAFGVAALTTEGTLAEFAYILNVTLAIVLMVLTWRDLRSRGWSWQAPVVGISYVVAPLVGLIAYIALSSREGPGDSPAPT